MTTFRPSIDWSHELLNSTLWVLQVWAITAVALLVVLVVVGRTTEWGRQFWRITGDYFKGSKSLPVWAVVGLLLMSAILVVRINVLLSYYANDLFSAMQVTFQPDSARSSGIHGFWMTILVFAVLAVCSAISSSPPPHFTPSTIHCRSSGTPTTRSPATARRSSG